MSTWPPLVIARDGDLRCEITRIVCPDCGARLAAVDFRDGLVVRLTFECGTVGYAGNYTPLWQLVWAWFGVDDGWAGGLDSPVLDVVPWVELRRVDDTP